MSRAFVRETESDTAGASSPADIASPQSCERSGTCRHRGRDNFEATHRNAADQGDREAVAVALREVRYWRARRASAEVVKPSEDKSKAAFGMTVTVRRDDGREQSFKIVGEDEADPSRGTVSYLSPPEPF